MKHYVEGLLFTGELDGVLLARRAGPQDALRGLRGAVAPGEPSTQVMRLTALERAGVDPAWEEIVALEYSDALIRYFACADTVAYHDARGRLYRIPYWSLPAVRPEANVVLAAAMARFCLFGNKFHQPAHLHMRGRYEVYDDGREETP